MQSRVLVGLVTFAALGAVVACSSASRPQSAIDSTTPGSSGTAGGFGPGSEPAGGTPGSEEPKIGCGKIDVLFVIDNSGSMAEEQTNLAKNFPDFVSVLEGDTTANGTPIDYRIAVTTTGRDLSITVVDGPLKAKQDMRGDNGAFRMPAKCDMTTRWLSKGDADLAKKFSCVASVGTDGPGIEMPLYASKLALVDRVADGTNKGFLRDDALLALVILTDEDDCSREDNNFSVDATSSNPGCEGSERRAAAEYGDVLEQVAPGRWSTHVIAGPGPGTCQSPGFGSAAEGTRLKQFVARAGKNGSFSSICDGELAGGLKAALSTFDFAFKNVGTGPK